MADVFSNIKKDIHNSVARSIESVAAEICENMKNKLIADGHAGSGQLLDSIGYTINQGGDGHISVTIDMAGYGKFIDQGTGAAHGGKRQGTWRYKDREGNWHTTDGMDADPFIDISVNSAIDNLAVNIASSIKSSIK